MKNERKSILNKIFSQKSDERLIEEVLSGSKHSFSTLMARNKNRVEALGFSFFHNSADVEDFVQDVFLKAYTNLSSFKGQSKFSTWLTRIAYTTAINSKTRRKEYESIADESELLDLAATPEDESIRKITILAIREAVKGLPSNYIVCIDLYFFYDLSYDEISVITAYPVNTIKSYIFRAKKILYQKLSEVQL